MSKNKKPELKYNGTAKLNLKELVLTKVQRFKDELIRNRTTTNLSEEWLYNRLKRLLLPGNYVACETCGMAVTWEGLTIDHKIPRSMQKYYRGNVHNVDNLEMICSCCNSLKGQKTLKEFLLQMQARNDDVTKLAKNINEIVAPMYPNIGLGLRIFGPDKSYKKYFPPKQHNSAFN